MKINIPKPQFDQPDKKFMIRLGLLLVGLMIVSGIYLYFPRTKYAKTSSNMSIPLNLDSPTYASSSLSTALGILQSYYVDSKQVNKVDPVTAVPINDLSNSFTVVLGDGDLSTCLTILMQSYRTNKAIQAVQELTILGQHDTPEEAVETDDYVISLDLDSMLQGLGYDGSADSVDGDVLDFMISMLGSPAVNEASGDSHVLGWDLGGYSLIYGLGDAVQSANQVLNKGVSNLLYVPNKNVDYVTDMYGVE